MKLENFATLAEAQAHTETTYSPITSNQALQFFRLSGAYKNLLDKQSSSVACEIITGLPTDIGQLTSAMIETMNKSGGEFTTDPSKTAGALNHAGAAALVESAVLTQAVVDAFFNIGTTIEKPFENATQAEFDAAKALAALIGTQASLKTNYPGNAEFHVRLPNKKVRLFVKVTNPVAVDTAVTITSYGCADNRDNTVASDFLRNARTLTVYIKAGESGGEIELTMPTARWLKFDAVANHLIGDFELDVQEA